MFSPILSAVAVPLDNLEVPRWVSFCCGDEVQMTFWRDCRAWMLKVILGLRVILEVALDNLSKNLCLLFFKEFLLVSFWPLKVRYVTFGDFNSGDPSCDSDFRNFTPISFPTFPGSPSGARNVVPELHCPPSSDEGTSATSISGDLCLHEQKKNSYQYPWNALDSSRGTFTEKRKNTKLSVFAQKNI